MSNISECTMDGLQLEEVTHIRVNLIRLYFQV